MAQDETFTSRYDKYVEEEDGGLASDLGFDAPGIIVNEPIQEVDADPIIGERQLEKQFSMYEEQQKARDESQKGLFGQWGLLSPEEQDKWANDEIAHVDWWEKNFWQPMRRSTKTMSQAAGFIDIFDDVPGTFATPGREGIGPVVPLGFSGAAFFHRKAVENIAHARHRKFLAEQGKADKGLKPTTITTRATAEDVSRALVRETGSYIAGTGRGLDIATGAFFGMTEDERQKLRLSFGSRLKGLLPGETRPEPDDKTWQDTLIEATRAAYKRDGTAFENDLEFSLRLSSGAMRHFGRFLKDTAYSLFPEDVARREEFRFTLAEGLGSYLSFMGPSMTAAFLAKGGPKALQMIIGAGTSAGLGAPMHAEAEAEAAERVGVKADDVKKIFLRNLPPGASEAIPVFTLLAKPSAGIFFHGLAQMGEEAFQEGILQQLPSNLIAQAIYDPERKWDEGVWEGMAVGGILGKASGLIAATAHTIRAPGIAVEEPAPEARQEAYKARQEKLDAERKAAPEAPAIAAMAKPEAPAFREPIPGFDEGLEDFDALVGEDVAPETDYVSALSQALGVTPVAEAPKEEGLELPSLVAAAPAIDVPALTEQIEGIKRKVKLAALAEEQGLELPDEVLTKPLKDIRAAILKAALAKPTAKAAPVSVPAAIGRDIEAVSTPDGAMTLPVRTEIVELSTLQAQTEKGALQPRDRTTAVSRAQVEERAQALDPSRLMPRTESGGGAPIILGDGTVLSGNGRVLALQQAYQDPGRVADYRAALGPGALDMAEPVVIQRVTSAPSQDDLTRFAELSNLRAPDIVALHPVTGLPRGSPEDLAARVDIHTERMNRPDWRAATKGGFITSTLPGFNDGNPTREFKDTRVYNEIDDNGNVIGEIKGWDAAVAWLVAKLEANVKGGVKREDRAWLIIGFAGAGKSTLSEPLGDNMGAVSLDSDFPKTIIQEYQGGANSSGVHDEASALGKAVLAEMVARGNNIVLEKLGTTDKSLRDAATVLSQAYNVQLLHVDVPQAVAMERAVGRYESPPPKGGRAVELETYGKLKAGEVYTRLQQEEGVFHGTGTVQWQETPPPGESDPQGWVVTEDNAAFEGIFDRPLRLGRVAGRGVDARDDRGDRGRDAPAGLAIAPEDIIQGRVGARERQTGQGIKSVLVDYAERLEAARGNESVFTPLLAAIQADRSLRKADALDLASLVGIRPTKSTTKGQAFASIAQRHADDVAFRARRDAGALELASLVPPWIFSGKFEYTPSLRPAGFETLPKGFTGLRQAPEHKFGIAQYDRPLTAQEIEDFSLVPLDPRDPVNLKKSFEAFHANFVDEFSKNNVYRSKDRSFVVTESTRPDVEWQITFFDKGEPTGHLDMNDFEEVSRFVWGKEAYPKAADIKPALTLASFVKQAKAGEDTIAWHSTEQKTIEVSPQSGFDWGFHVAIGSPKAAQDRLGKIEEEGRVVKPRLLTLRLKVRNPLRVHDLGTWEAPTMWRKAVEETPEGKAFPDNLKAVINKYADEWDDPPRSRTVTRRGTTMEFTGMGRSDARDEVVYEFREELSKALDDAGHDAIVYKNRFEDVGQDSVAVWRSDLVEQASLAPGVETTEEALARYRPEFEARRPAIFAALTAEIEAMLPPTIAARVIDRLRYGDTIAAGSTDVVNGLIRISMEFGEDFARATGRHEVIHALRELGLFTDQEWATLRDRANKVIGDNLRVPVSKYRALYRPTLELQGWRGKFLEARLDELIDQERVALMAEAYAGGARYGSRIDALLGRIGRFLEAARNALAGQGFQTVEDVFESAFTGEVAQRAERPQGVDEIIEAVGRSDRGVAFPIKESGFIDPEATLASIAAFHGSPHDFDAFDIAQIGTGEGAQAFGYGLYFAEEQQVAEAYRDVIEERVLYKGKEDPGGFDEGLAAGRVLLEIDEEGIEPQRAIDLTVERFEKEGKAALARAARSLSAKDFTTLRGRLYQVTITAEPEAFLDFDKPLSEHSESVRTALQSVFAKTGQKRTNLEDYTSVPDLMGDQQDLLSPVSFTQALREAGIPGIRYLDQESRSEATLPGVIKTTDIKLQQYRAQRAKPQRRRKNRTPDATLDQIIENLEALLVSYREQAAQPGTYNYVVFDDALIQITHKDGAPVEDNERQDIITDTAEGFQLASLVPSKELPPEIDQGLETLAAKIATQTAPSLFRGATQPGAVTPLRTMIADLKAALGMTATQGRYGLTVTDLRREREGERPKRFRFRPQPALKGQYDRTRGVARYQLSSDIDAIAHEGGHHLERLFGNLLERLKGAHRGELQAYAVRNVTPAAPDTPVPAMPPQGYSGIDLDADAQRILVETAIADEQVRDMALQVGQQKTAGRPFDATRYAELQRQAGTGRAELTHRLGQPVTDAVLADTQRVQAQNRPQYVQQRFSETGSPRAPAIDARASLSEGFAEFFREYILNPGKAQAFAPQFHAAFEAFLTAQAPNLVQDFNRAQLITTSAEYDAYLRATTLDRARADLVSNADHSLRAKANDVLQAIGQRGTISGALSRIYQSGVDEAHPFYLAVKGFLSRADVAGKTDDQGRPISLAVHENPYKLMRSIGDSFKTGLRWIQDGMPNYRESGGVRSASLHAALSLVMGKSWNLDTYGDAGNYLESRRAVEEWKLWDAKRTQLAGLGQRIAKAIEQNTILRAKRTADESTASAERIAQLDAGIASREQIQSEARQEINRLRSGGLQKEPHRISQAEHEERIRQLEARHPKLPEMAAMVYDFLWQQSIHDFQAGSLTQAKLDYRQTRRHFYVPFARDLSDKISGETGMGRRALGKRFAKDKTFRGSDRDVINPIETIIDQTFHKAAATHWNEVADTLATLGENAGPGGAEIAELVTREEAIAADEAGFKRLESELIAEGHSPDDAHEMTKRVESDFGDTHLLLTHAPEHTGADRPLLLPLYRNGERSYVRINDPAFAKGIADSVNGMGRELSNVFMRALAAPASWLRISITTSPAFLIPNVVRDMFSAWILTGSWLDLRTYPIVTQARGLYHEFRQTDMARLHQEVGGLMGGQNVNALSRVRDKADVMALKERGLQVQPMKLLTSSAIGAAAGFATMGPAGAAMGAILGAGFSKGAKNFWRTTAMIAELSETATRLGVFTQAYQAAKQYNPNLTDYQAAQEAAYVARDLIDFGRRGSKMLVVARIVPFLNANIQGLDKATRAILARSDRGFQFSTAKIAGTVAAGAAVGALAGPFGAVVGAAVAPAVATQLARRTNAVRYLLAPFHKKHTGQTLSADDERVLGQSAKAWTTLMAYSFLLFALKMIYDDEDDDEYKMINDRVKWRGQPVKIMGEWFVIPKAFEWAVPSNLFEAGFDAQFRNDPRFIERVLDGLYEATAPPFIPQVGKVWSDIRGNHRSYTGGPITPDYMRRALPPQEQYNAYSSQLAIGISRYVNAHKPLKATVEAVGGTIFAQKDFELSPLIIDYAINTSFGYWGRDVQKASNIATRDTGRIIDYPIIGTVVQRLTIDPFRASEAKKLYYEQMGRAGETLPRAAGGYDNALKNRGQAAANQFLATLTEDQRAYALVMAQSSTASRRLHPMNRVKAASQAIGAVERDLITGKLEDTSAKGDPQPLTLAPKKTAEVLDLLAQIKGLEFWNAMTALGLEQFEGENIKDLKPLWETLKASSPEVYKEMQVRYDRKKVSDFDDAVQEWPKIKKELFEDYAESIREGHAPIIGAKKRRYR